MWRCNGGEDEPCHHVPVPVSLQSGELPPWVLPCLQGQDYGPRRRWKPSPAAQD